MTNGETIRTLDNEGIANLILCVKIKRIKELERQRRQYLNDYKLGLRKALEVVTYIREIDAELAEMKEEE